MSDGTVIAGLVRNSVANITTTSFRAITPTATPPTGMLGPKQSANFIVISPFGADAENKTFNMRVLAIELNPAETTYFLRPLAEFAVTLGALTGATGLYVTGSEFFADTITQTFGANSCRVVSPGNDLQAYVVVDMEGAERVVLDFDRDTATACNALYKMI